MGANRSAPSHNCFQVFCRVDFAPRITVIRKGSIRTHEDIIFKADAVPELDATLDGHSIADHDVIFDENMVTDVTFRSDDRASKEVRKCPNSGTRTDIQAIADPLRMDIYAHRRHQIHLTLVTCVHHTTRRGAFDRRYSR